MILRIQSQPTKQTLNSWKTILRSSANSESSMNASLCSTHGPMISIRLTSNTSWIMIWPLMFVRTLELKTHKFSGFHSSKAKLLCQPMTSSAPSENWHNLTKFHLSMRLIFPPISSRQSSLISSFPTKIMLIRLQSWFSKLPMLDKQSVTMHSEIKSRHTRTISQGARWWVTSLADSPSQTTLASCS